MAATLVGYARCSTDKQDLEAQHGILLGLGVAAGRIYLDRGLTGTRRARPGLDQASAAVRPGDTLVVPKLDRLAPLGARRPGDRRLVVGPRGEIVAGRQPLRGRGRQRWTNRWKAALNAFAITFDGRILTNK